MTMTTLTILAAAGLVASLAALSAKGPQARRIRVERERHPRRSRD